MSTLVWRLQRLLFLMLLGKAAAVAWAQGELATGTLTASGSGPIFDYSLTFSDAANASSPIGSIWYAWVPGAFYLPAGPKSASSPPGWTANVSGHSVQWVANSAANDIMPGRSLSGFGYTATFSPAQLAAAPNSGVSVAYSGQLFSDTGYTFTVKVVDVPEPCTGVLLVLGLAGQLFFRQRKRAGVAKA